MRQIIEMITVVEADVTAKKITLTGVAAAIQDSFFDVRESNGKMKIVAAKADYLMSAKEVSWGSKDKSQLHTVSVGDVIQVAYNAE